MTINDLPDSAFLYIEPGGEKDDDGKTVPRSLRHFPYKDADGKVDLPHLRNALARIPQSSLAQDVKDKCTAKARDILDKQKEGVEEIKIVESIDFSEAKVNDEKRDIEVTIIKAGKSLNNRNYPAEVLQKATPLYEGVKSFADHGFGFFGRGVREVIGYVKEPSFEGDRIRANLHIFESAQDIWLLIKEAIAEGVGNLIGLSHAVSGRQTEKEIDGVMMMDVYEINKVHSVDVVTEPAAGGGFERIVASVNSKLTADDLSKINPKLVKEIASKTLNYFNVNLAERKKEKDDMEIQEIEKLLADKAAEQDKKLAERMDEIQKKADCKILLLEKLTESKLPDSAKEKIKTSFVGKVFEPKELEDEIAAVEAIIKEVAPKEDLITDEGKTKVVIENREKAQLAMDGLFDMTNDKGVKAFRGIREAYKLITGDEDVTEQFKERDLKGIFEGIVSGDFSYILGTSMHKRLAQDYKTLAQDWRKIVTVRPIPNFKTQEVDRYGTFSDLSTVSTESASYTDLGKLSDEQVTYSISTRGGIAQISRKTIINDDMRAFDKLPTKLARAAVRTLETFVFNFIKNNSTYGVDSKALFHANHGNLGSASLSSSALQAGITAMGKQTDGKERLGLQPAYLLVPVDLRWTAAELLNSAYLVGGTNETINVLKGICDVIVVKYFTDTDNWYLVANPADIETIEIGFLNGQETPELFLQNQPTVDKVFTEDAIRYKVRHEYGGSIVDYRGFYGAVV